MRKRDLTYNTSQANLPRLGKKLFALSFFTVLVSLFFCSTYKPTAWTGLSIYFSLSQLGGANTPELSIDERKQKHVSFDASSLMRSQTLATMDETSFQRAAAAAAAANAGGGGGAPGGVLLPAHSSERLIDSTAMGGSQGFRDSLDFAYISEMLPPELARQIMLGKRAFVAKLSTLRLDFLSGLFPF